MADEIFEMMRRRILREHKFSIVRSAKNGHKAKGRGMVLVKFTKKGMVHLSYLTIDALKAQYADSDSTVQDSGDILLRKLSAYSPESEIPVMFTDGQSERFSLGVRQASHAIQPTA
jgi:hypothetical protein